MFVISLHEIDRVLHVFDTEQTVDDGQVFPITAEEQVQLWKHGANGDFRYVDGKILLDPKPIEPV